MKQWQQCLVESNTTIREALQIIDKTSLQISLVVDEKKFLLGTVTDGDVRRGILKGISPDQPVHLIMNRHPMTATSGMSREQILEKMNKNQFRHMPIVDKMGYVVGLEVFEDLLSPNTYENWVVLMAGGLGTRLKPLTDNCPKPLLSVGDKPLLETIIKNFLDDGFRKFYISVNYKANMIQECFGDGSKWKANIQYLLENDRTGTAGALGLLPERPSLPFFVMNGDVLTKVKMQQLLEFHKESKAMATMCVREYDFQVPYGVVKMDGGQIIGLDEKPIHRFFVNAGIYVLEPEAIDVIPSSTYVDMPTVFERLIARGDKTVVFPIMEYWLDIGKIDDFKRAQGEFQGIFSKR